MPKWVADHATWEKAKAAALKNYDESDKNFYAIVASIYEKMGGKVEHHETKGAAFELSDDVVRASTTTEVSQARDDVMAGDYPGHPFRGNQYAEGEGEGGEHNVASSRAHAHSMSARTSAQHRKAASAHRHASKLQREEGHDETADYHEAAAKYHEKKSKSEAAHASDPVFCRDYAGTTIEASTPWAPDQETKFMHMPAGVHTITAGFRDRAVRLTVDVEPTQTASVLQASFDRLQSSAPKQKPFGCVEHDERDASFWPTRFESGSDGVYLAGEPSALGAEHVNGKIHRSWSPSFTTDADYAHAVCATCHEEGGECACKGSVLEFPEGVRGSVSNPARVTGTAFVVGTLTNKPAFRAIAPVKAREVSDSVRATGTSEGARKGWLERANHHAVQADSFRHKANVATSFDTAHDHAILASTHATQASDYALRHRSSEAHDHAVQAHLAAKHAHEFAAGHLKYNDITMRMFHEAHARHHEEWNKRHAHWSDLANFGPHASEPKTTTVDILRSKPAPDHSSISILARLRPPPGARQA